MATVIKQNKPTRNKLAIARRRRRLNIFKKTVIISFGIAVLFSLIIYGLQRPEVNIKNIEVEGTSVLKSEFLKDTAKVELNGSYLWIIPKTSAFFYPKKAILNRLIKQFKRINTIQVEKMGFNTIYIRVTERPERYLWCGRDLIEFRGSENKCYFIDSGGYVFSPAPYYSGNLFLEFYGPLRGGENDHPVGGIVLPEERFRDLVLFNESLQNMDIPATKVFIDSNDDYEFTLLDGGKLLVGGKNDLAKNSEYIELALNTDPLKSKMEKTRDRLLYLDVRFGNKVYFKFR